MINTKKLEEKFAPTPGEDTGNGSAGGFDLKLKRYLEDHGIKIKGIKTNGTGTLYLLNECLFDPNHRSGEAAIGQTNYGKLFYQCFHDSCKGHTWQEAQSIISGDEKLTPFIKNHESVGKIKEVSRPLYKPLTVATLLTLQLPERGHIIHPVCPEQGLVMVYGPRGNGKTWFVLQMAYAIASGGAVFTHWQAPKPRRVLYIDGEMPVRTIQERLAMIVEGSDYEPPDPSNLSILTPDLQDCAMPNLAHQEGQDAIGSFTREADVIIVDNLACLARHGRENESESWLPVQTWLLGLRRQGKAVITVHHAGKGGLQRGTSSREDVLDTVISLRRPKDYDPSEGARFEVHLEKARGVYGPDATPFELTLRTPDGAALWLTRSIEDVDRDRVQSLKSEGLSIRDIALETGLSKSKVQRLLKGVSE